MSRGRRSSPKFAGVSQVRAVAALQKAGFQIIRQIGHIVMGNGQQIVTIPRHIPINAITMGNIIRDAGLTNDEFRALSKDFVTLNCAKAKQLHLTRLKHI